MGTPLPLEAPPGVLKYESALGSQGRYVDAQMVRFWRGKPEKMGGWTSWLAAGHTLVGEVDALFAWNDLTVRQWIAAGTEKKLYAIPDTDATPLDITPFAANFAGLANPFTTTNGSSSVVVAITSHNAALDQEFIISGAAAVGGLSLNGAWSVATIVDVDHITFVHTSAATSGATGGGAAVDVQFILAPGARDPAGGYGWNAGSWGQGAWGTARDFSSITVRPRVWSLQNYGKLLLACPGPGATLYSFDPTTLPVVRAAAVANAPTLMEGFFVTSERSVIAWGTNYGGTQDLMQFWTSGQGDHTDWTVGNLVSTAGGAPSISRRLQQGTAIMAGADFGSNINLMWTDTALYQNQYIGGALAYSTRLVGTECGLLGPKAFVIAAGAAYWISVNSFKMWNGGAPVDIPNSQDIVQWAFDMLAQGYETKCFARYNQLFGEVVFALVRPGETTASLELIYQPARQEWNVNILSRTAACYLAGTTRRPILAGVDGKLYKHETGHDADGAPLPWSLTLAPMKVGDGGQSFDIFALYVDMQRQIGTINVTLTAYNRSPATPTPTDSATGSWGPGDDMATLSNALEGRFVGVTYSGGAGVGDDFRFGTPTLDVVGAGARP